MVREFRIIDYINVILFLFFRDNQITDKIKSLQTKYLERIPKDEDFQDFDVKTFNSFSQALIELLLLVTKRDYLNHLYNSQFVRVYIHLLTVTNVGVYRLTSRESLLANRKLILECCKEFLWDQDLDALGQLNYYGTHLFSAIRDEDDYEALYIQLLDHQCRSKAPNLDNKVAATFITDFFTIQEDLRHTFPRIENVDGKLMVYFVRKCNKPGLNHEIPLQDLCIIRQGGKKTENHEFKHLTDYLIKSFKLLNSISNLNHLVYFQTIINYYPLGVLQEIAEKTNISFFELSTLASDVIKNAHFNYFMLPIEKFPVQIQIVGDRTEIDKYLASTNELIDRNTSELLSEVELEVLEEKKMKEEVMKNLERYKIKKRSNMYEEESKKRGLHKNEDGNIVATLAKLRSFLETSIDDISIDYLRETHELFSGILAETVEDMYANNPKYRKLMESEKEENPKAKKKQSKKADRKDPEHKEPPNSAVERQKFNPEIALEILSMFGTIDHKFVNIAAMKIIETIKERVLKKPPGDHTAPNRTATEMDSARALAGTAAMYHIENSTAQLVFDKSVILASVIETNKEIWKSRAVLYQIVNDNKTIENVKEEFKQYSTDSLIKTLFEMILFKKTPITREVIHELRKIAKFENSLYVELKKMTMIGYSDDMNRVSEIIKIVCKLSYYARMYKCKEIFNKEIPKEKLKEIYKEIDTMINYLLFSIYSPKKHFRYTDPNAEAEEDRFLEGFKKWKTPRWDKPFRLNPEAINRTYQKIFLTLQVPKALFQLISMTIAITGDTYNDLDYIFVIRKAVVILCAFVCKNEENQNALYDQKFMILSYYQQTFINQTCDVMTLFTELMRDNKRLQKLPIKYLYDITWYTFLGTLNRSITGVESNSYLCTALMGLHFLSRMTIGGFNALATITDKFSQICSTLKADTSLDVFYMYQPNQVITLPFHYYSIREFFCSWIEICPKFVKDNKILETILGDIKLSVWSDILKNPALSFQFEIRNLLCKALEITWYGRKTPYNVVNNFDEFKTLIFRLFADLSAYIWMSSKEREDLQGLKEYHFQVDPDSLFGEDSYTLQLKEAIRKFKHDEIKSAKFQVYIEDIGIMNLWKEYIYEGCIGLLNTIVQREAESMTTTIDYSDEKFPNLISYYLYFLEKIAQIPESLKVDPFPKIDDDLVKISVLPEYKSVKEKIHQIAQVLRESRPALKSRTKKSSNKTKNEAVGVDMYEFELEKLLKSKKTLKEQNTLRLAGIVSGLPCWKEIVKEIITYIKKEYKKVKPCELTFIMKLLRKLIEKENREEKLRNVPIYMWDQVKLTDLQNMQRIQNHYKDCGLTEFMITTVTEVKNSNVLTEFLQLSIAYLYGGNSDVQEEFYQEFINDYDNTIVNILREKFLDYSDAFKSSEKMRINILYRESVRNTFELLEEDNPQIDPKSAKFFEDVQENFLPEQTIDCMKMKGPSMLVLIFTFLQGLAERQCTNLQNFMREQIYTDENGDNKTLANSYDFLSEFRTLFNVFFRIHSQYNLTVGIKLIDVLTEYVQGKVTENIKSLLNKTLLFDMTRVLTDFNNSYHLLPRGYDHDAYSGSFRELKGKVISFLKSLVEFPDDKIRERIKKYLDVHGLMDAFEANMYAYFKFDYNKPPPSNADQAWLLFRVSSFKMEDFEDGPLMDAVNIYTIFRYLWVEKNLEDNTLEFEENVNELIAESKRSFKKKEFLELLIYTFCPKIVHGVEVLLDRQLVKFWFPRLPVCRYLLKSTKESFEDTVDRSNIQSKITGLMDATDVMIPQMYSDYKASQRFLGFNTTNLYSWIRIIADGLAIAINVTNLATLECDSTSSGSSYTCDNFNYNPDSGYVIEKVFVIVNIVVAALVLLLWFLTSSKRYLSTKWEIYSDANAKELGLLQRSITEKLEDRQYSKLEKDECIQILKLKGMNSDEYDILLSQILLRRKIRWFLLRMNIWFILQSVTFVWHFVYLGLSIGSLFSPISASLLIADIAIQSAPVIQVFRAMGTNWKQFLWTLFLLMNIALFYTFISFYAYQATFVDQSGDALCTYAFGCFLNILDSGLRAGGGIGDVIQGQTYTTNNVGHFFGRVVFDLTFFIIMITILLNLIFGMIIDAFGNLRDQKNANEDDATNICFICGIDRAEFERYMNFDDHINKEHNKWDYIFFVTYIKEKYKNKRTDMTQLENYVNGKCLARNNQWFPQTRSLTLEKKRELAQAQEDDSNKVIAETVKDLSKDLSDLKKKVLGPIVASLEGLKETIGSSKDHSSAITEAIKSLTNEVKDLKKKMNIPSLERAGTLV